jgi:hypothetical protein
MLGVLPIVTLLAVAAQSGGQPWAVGEGPEPSPTPISWEFEFRFADLRRITVQTAGASGPQDYWYLLYTAVNTSPRTQRFYPEFEAVTDDLRVVGADIGISPIVFDAIRERHRVTHPYLVHPTEAIGELKSGEDNARESVAIWRADDLAVNNFTIYVAGLSGESRLVPNPVYDPQRPETTTVTGVNGRAREVVVNPRLFTLRKTLAIRYKLPGSDEALRRAEPVRVGVEWVMR